LDKIHIWTNISALALPPVRYPTGYICEATVCSLGAEEQGWGYQRHPQCPGLGEHGWQASATLHVQICTVPRRCCHRWSPLFRYRRNRMYISAGLKRLHPSKSRQIDVCREYWWNCMQHACLEAKLSPRLLWMSACIVSRCWMKWG